MFPSFPNSKPNNTIHNPYTVLVRRIVSQISNMVKRWETDSMTGAVSSSPNSVLGKLRRMLSPTTSRTASAGGVSNSHVGSRGGGATRRDLRRVFAFFDEDGDGKITPAELQSCVRSVGGYISAEDAEAALKSWDIDGDGALGMEDFQGLMEGSDGSEEEKREELRQAFGMYEAEPGSDSITPTSLKRMLSRLGQSCSVADCKAMILPFDLNGDGVLNFHEFTLMMR